MLLTERLPDPPEPDALLDAFVDHVGDNGIELYEAQEEAILELLSGNHVILNTPTGSGKSLVAEAAHFAAMATGRRSVYTAPIKALVSEKFFALCRDLGSDNVGMITGDAAVNPSAPVICCTAEILANWALRDGRHADVGLAVVDEFHYYADPQRGWAWQVPLLELPHVQFLLMSATLGPTHRFEEDLTGRTGRPTVVVRSAQRPVPLTFEYRTSSLLESIQELLGTDRAPVYLVHFTQREATAAAQSLMSIDVLTRDQKAEVRDLIGGFRFDSPIGTDLRRYLSHGIGVHHAGLLPKYRLLVEKLAQAGLLKLICGTDTLGVGVNVPIRSVVFTQLCKYDGSSTRLLSVREFQQIAGRAGRKGFDDEGFVWAQAPAHVVENRKAQEKAANDPKKRKKLVKKKPPERNYVPWSQDTFDKLRAGQPESLDSSFTVSHQMLMNVLDRPGDGCRAVQRLLTTNHEPRKRQRRHIRRAVQIYRSLVAGGVVEQLDEPDELGRRVRVTVDLQDDFALNQPLSLFAVEMIATLDADSPTHALDVLSVVESVLENPGVIIAAQVDKAKQELLGALKAEGVEYEQRMEELSKVEHPKPLRDELYGHFNVFRDHHPWVGQENVRPKAVAREMFERAMTFREYVNHYGLKRSEGVLLRYLSDAYKGLVQNVPEDHKTDAVHDTTEWLGELVRQVDSSLIDEWERLRSPDDTAPQDLVPPGDDAAGTAPRDVTANTRAFRVMVRNEVFRWVQLLARRDHTALAEVPEAPGLEPWTPETLEGLMEPYWALHDHLDTGPDARSPALFEVDEEPLAWPVRQVLVDPEGWQEWSIEGEVDLEASREEGTAVVRLRRVGPTGA